MRNQVREIASMHRWWVLLGLVFVLSRALYFAAGMRIDTTPVGSYLQYVDPALLRNHLWQSLLYLHEQPPGFNLYLGLVLKSGHPAVVFLAVQLLLGLALAFSLMSLMTRLGIVPWLAFAFTTLFVASPITMLYENWVFYEYPVMVFLTVAAWALERCTRTASFRHFLIFFAAIATVASIRAVYHLAWFLLLAVWLLSLARHHWRRILLAAAVPGILIVAVYLKNYVMFGDIIPGQVFRKMNFADMVQQQAPDGSINRLERQGRIGNILEIPALDTDVYAFAGSVNQPARTGIPLFDAPRKSTGANNWNSTWMAKVADAEYRDAQVVADEDPEVYWRQIRANLRAYLLPATDVFPFNATPVANSLRPFLNWYERITSGELSSDSSSNEDPVAWLNLWLFPACLVGGIVFAVRTRSPTLSFLLFNIVYDTAVTVLFASGDHNRYREEVATYYVVFSGLLLNGAWVRLTALTQRFVPLLETK